MLLKIARFIFLTLILGVLIALGAMQLQPVKEFFIAKGVDLFTRYAGQHLEVEDVELLLPFEIKITHPHLLTLDGKERFEASSLLIRVNPYSFFSGEIHIHSLIIEDPVFHFDSDSDNQITTQELLSFLPAKALTVNNLQLLRYQVPENLQNTIRGTYDIEAKIEYDPNEGYAYATGKAIDTENREVCLDGNIALFTDADTSYLGFEVNKTKGIFLGKLADFSGRLAGSFSGSYNDWDQFFQDPEAVSKYHLTGQIRSSWTHFKKDTNFRVSLSTSAELGNDARIRLTDLQVKTPLFNLESTLVLGQDGSLDGTQGNIRVDDISDLFSTFNLENEAEAKGPAAINFQLYGMQEALRGDIEFFSNKINAFGNRIDTITGLVTFTKSKDEYFADLVLNLIDDRIKGNAEASISYTTKENVPQLNMHLLSKNLDIDALDLEDLNVDLTVDGALNELSYSGKASAKTFTHKGEKFKDIDLKIDQDSLFQLNFNYLEDRFLVEGTYKTLGPEKFQFDITQFMGKVRGEPLLLKEPFQLTTDLSSFEATPAFFSFGKGSVYAIAKMHANLWNFSFSFQEVPCGIFPFEEYFNQHLEGDLEGEALFYGTVDEMQGSMRLNVHDLFAKEDLGKDLPVVKGSMSASFVNKQMKYQGEVLGIGNTPFTFQGILPLTLSLKAPFASIDHDAPLQAHIHAEGSLTPLMELLIQDASSLTGNGKIQMQVQGTLNEPQFLGSFTLRDAVFEIYELGTIITDIEADLVGNGNRLELTRLKGSDGAQGLISGSGSLLLSKKKGFPFRFDIALNNAKPVDVDILKGTASGSLSWHGTIDGSIVEGNLEIEQGGLSLAKKIPETSVSYPVRYINNDSNPLKPTEILADGSEELPIELKINVTTREDLAINDEDLKSNWSGKVSVIGKIQKPQIFGEIKLQSGDYILNGKRFVLSQGRVSFNGDFDKKAHLYVSLSREIGDHEVEIILKGLLKDPDILLQSHPSLPKQQVLSLILFGRTSADISELQEEQLEQSLSNLTTSSSKKDGTLSKFQKTLGIDHIDFMRSGEASSDFRIRVSKYISRGICLSVSRDVAEDINAVSLEAELQKNIKAQIEAQDNAQGQVSIFWKKNY